MMKQETTLPKQNKGKPLADSGFVIKVKDFLYLLTMPLPELEAYHHAKRKERFKQGKKSKKIHIQEICYPAIREYTAMSSENKKCWRAVLKEQYFDRASYAQPIQDKDN